MRLNSDKIEEIVKSYRQEENQDILNHIKNEVTNELQGNVESSASPMHYIRSRVKSPVSLDNKIDRKEDRKREFSIKMELHEEVDSYKDLKNINVLSDIINDLVGVRILVLYRNDIPIVNEYIRNKKDWEIKECIGYYDKNRHHDKEWFEEHGFYKDKWYLDNLIDNDHLELLYSTLEKRGIESSYDKMFEYRKKLRNKLNGYPLLIPSEYGYSSVHHIIHIDEYDIPIEIQIRTIHQDAWGEFSHEISYPEKSLDTLASSMVTRLSGLVNFAEDMVSDIRKSPANALISNQLMEEYKKPGETNFKERYEAVANNFLKNAPYITESAPLSALRILGKGIDGLETGDVSASGPDGEVLTLDFGTRKAWDHPGELTDPLRTLYLDTHEKWLRDKQNQGNEKASIKKFFVWPQEDKIDPEDECNDLVDEYAEKELIDFYMISECYFRDVLISIRKSTSIILSGLQFFMWDVAESDRLDSKSMNPAQLPSPVELRGGTCTYGFYSPSVSSDLTSNVIQINENQIKSDTSSYKHRIEKNFNILSRYANLLKCLVNEGVIQKYKDWNEVNVDDEVDNVEVVINSCVKENFREYLNTR